MTSAVQTSTVVPPETPASLGTYFVTFFPWNNGDQNNPPIIWLDLINPNDEEAEILICYSEVHNDGEVVVERKNSSVIVGGHDVYMVGFTSLTYKNKLVQTTW